VPYLMTRSMGDGHWLDCGKPHAIAYNRGGAPAAMARIARARRRGRGGSLVRPRRRARHQALRESEGDAALQLSVALSIYLQALFGRFARPTKATLASVDQAGELRLVD
jgi:hypothetical protein